MKNSAFIFNSLPCICEIVIASPTGSGKTHILELAIMRAIQKRGHSPSIHPGGKVVYISPIKSLCQEIARDWKAKFEVCNLRVLEFTGDTEGEILPSDLGV